jgi:ABC-type polysaccharide/polyol phosphate transport system ATPase subunit
MVLIEFDHVTKAFPHASGSKLLRAHLLDRFRQKESFRALTDVSFQVSRGESFAVVGRNGAGKSTLLSLVAGVCAPTQGSVRVNGRVAALLEVGSGFHPDLTGRENVYLNAAILGLSRRQTDESFNDIVEFSGLADFVHEPVRTYSTGMMLRLAFSVAIHVDPDILIIDEVLAVGDQDFQAKCLSRIYEFRRMGKTFLFVSHGAQLVRDLCDRALWLDHGAAVLMGTADEVLQAYSGSHDARPLTLPS